MADIFRFTVPSRCAAVCALAIGLCGGHLWAQSTSTPPPQDTAKSQTSVSPRIGQGPEKNKRPTFRRWGMGAFSVTRHLRSNL